MISHFIRGYFDGDGHIGFYGNRCKITILGTEPLLQGIKKIFESNIPNIGVQINKAKKTTDIMQLVINGGRQVENTLDYIYSDAEMYLTRKFETYMEVKNRDKNIWEVRKRIQYQRKF
jgi:hypothetical protein